MVYMKKLIFLILLSTIGSAQEQLLKESPTHVAFGSCNLQVLKQDYWANIAATKPDLWIWGGDIIYADLLPLGIKRKQYNRILQNEGYQNLLSNSKIVGIWDDHDFASNDSDGSYKKKAKSQNLLLDFLQVPNDSPRRVQEGIYTSYLIGDKPTQFKLILLDVRYFRSAPNEQANMLGDVQWKWLENEIQINKSKFIVIVSGSQIIQNEGGKHDDSWTSMPTERERFFKLIEKSKAPVLLLSGDRHFAEVSMLKIGNRETYEFTSSGLTHHFNKANDNPFRVAGPALAKNYGVLNITWKRHPIVEMQALNPNNPNEVLFSKSIELR